MVSDKKNRILDFVKENPLLSSKEIHSGLNIDVGYSTVKRILTKLISDKLISSVGNGKARKYVLSPSYELFYPIDVNVYFEKEIDERKIKDRYNFTLIRDV